MLQRIKALLKYKGYNLFTRLYELNIVGLRNRNTKPNSFDDELHVFFKTSPLHWEYHVFRITTDPGTFWLENPMQQQGTAILAEGQYIHAYALGLHRGQYKALVQVKPITIMRDYDRKAMLDFYNGKKQSGMFGINIHRANATGTTKTIDKYSAGCQVFSNAIDFAAFLGMCEKHKSLYGNQFTYTLIDFRSWQRQTYRRIATLLGTLATLGFGTHYFLKNNTHERLFKRITKR